MKPRDIILTLFFFFIGLGAVLMGLQYVTELQNEQSRSQTNSGHLNTKDYSCPEQEWVNCQPPMSQTKVECSDDYIDWALENCQGFTGPVY